MASASQTLSAKNTTKRSKLGSTFLKRAPSLVQSKNTSKSSSNVMPSEKWKWSSVATAVDLLAAVKLNSPQSDDRSVTSTICVAPVCTDLPKNARTSISRRNSTFYVQLPPTHAKYRRIFSPEYNYNHVSDTSGCESGNCSMYLFFGNCCSTEQTDAFEFQWISSWNGSNHDYLLTNEGLLFSTRHFFNPVGSGFSNQSPQHFPLFQWPQLSGETSLFTCWSIQSIEYAQSLIICYVEGWYFFYCILLSVDWYFLLSIISSCMDWSFFGLSLAKQVYFSLVLLYFFIYPLPLANYSISNTASWAFPFRLYPFLS